MYHEHTRPTPRGLPSPGDYRTDRPRGASAPVQPRAVQGGDALFAVPGTQVDGHRFIDNAIAAGARAVICEGLPRPPRSRGHIREGHECQCRSRHNGQRLPRPAFAPAYTSKRHQDERGPIGGVQGSSQLLRFDKRQCRSARVRIAQFSRIVDIGQCGDGKLPIFATSTEPRFQRSTMGGDHAGGDTHD